MEHKQERGAHHIQIEHTYRVRDSENEVIAHLEVQDHRGVYWVSNLWVSGKRRREGIATALMERMLEEWHTKDLHLSIKPYTDGPMGYQALEAFYRRYDFASTGVAGIMRRYAGGKKVRHGG